MNSKWQRAGQQVKPGLKIVGKLALLTALRLWPGGRCRLGGQIGRAAAAENAAGGGAGAAAQPAGQPRHARDEIMPPWGRRKRINVVLLIPGR